MADPIGFLDGRVHVGSLALEPGQKRWAEVKAGFGVVIGHFNDLTLFVENP